MPKQPQAPVDYSPQPPAYTASGTTNVSGIATSANFEGPWYIQTQSLNIEYNRVPYGYLSATDVSLSDATSTHVVNGTAVIATVNAAYRSRQDWGTYETSSWELPQKFEILAASTDAQDRSYGDITASTMGPMGNIVTTQEFYRRVPWVGAASGQVEVDRNAIAANYYALTVNESYPQGLSPYSSSSVETSGALLQSLHRFDYDNWFSQEPNRGSFNSHGDPHLQFDYMMSYQIPGTYATVKESLWQILNFIDQCGNQISYENLYAVPTEIWNGAVRNVGFSEYDVTRHDYS